MNKPSKEIIVWIHNGDGGYIPHEFDTVEEALLSEKFTEDWYITRVYNKLSSVYLSFEESKTPTKS